MIVGMVVVAVLVGGCVGFLVGQRHERLAGSERFNLARRYWEPEEGASAVTVSLALIAVGVAYIAGHLLVWSLR